MRECLIKAIALSLLYNLVLGSFFLDEAARMRMLTHAPLQMTSKPDLGNSYFDIFGGTRVPGAGIFCGATPPDQRTGNNSRCPRQTVADQSGVGAVTASVIVASIGNDRAFGGWVFHPMNPMKLTVLPTIA